MAATMYRLPPIIDSAAVNVCLPTCMYRMEPINQPEAVSEQTLTTSKQKVVGGAEGAAELTQLERRQEVLLTRLADLRRQVEDTQRQLGTAGVTMATASRATADVTADAPLPHPGELVVVASPSCPPLSVLALRPLLPHLSVTSHAHSSVSDVSEKLQHLFCWRATAQPCIQLRVIWKQVSGVDEPSLVVSPGVQPCALSGEEQLCRYLARALLPHHYEGGGLERAAAVDDLLEGAARLRHGAGKERQTALKALHAALSSHPFLLGDRQTLVDGAVWSALKGAGLSTPPAVTAWTARMDAAAQLGSGDWQSDAGQHGKGTSTAASTTKRTVDKQRTPSTANAASSKTKTTKLTPGSAPPPRKPAAPKSAPAPQTVAPTGGPAISSTAARPAHRTELSLLHYLARRDVSAQTVRHPPVMTVEAMLPYLQHVTGGLSKNLFLRDKKKALYLLTAPHDAEFKLADVAAQVPGAKELRFGDESSLWELLGVRPGCVTPFALINDTGRQVRLLLDRRLVDGTHATVWFHPLTNTATTGISHTDLARFLRAIEHEPTLLTLQ